MGVLVPHSGLALTGMILLSRPTPPLEVLTGISLSPVLRSTKKEEGKREREGRGEKKRRKKRGRKEKFT